MFASDNTGLPDAGHGRRQGAAGEAGWTDSDGDGIRDKDGKKLSILYQTSTNPSARTSRR
jgi:peptide/nickel transport system substrate-binding protein